MSKKETVQNEAPEKVLTKYDKKVQKRKEAELKAKKQKRNDKIIGFIVAAVIVIAIAAIPVKTFIATHSTYITVGGHDVTKVEFDYYYNLAYTDYLNSYGDYIAYMGLDTTKDLDDQQYSDTLTWHDYFAQAATENIREVKALADAAAAAGFTYDATADVESFKESIKEAASGVSMTTNKYYKASFGNYATASRIAPFVEEGYYTSAYYTSVSEEKQPTEAEIKEYYEANTASYDSVDFLLTEVAAEVPEGETTTDADGNVTTVEPTEEEIAAAMAEAKKAADAALEVIETEGTENTGMLKSSISTKYNEWLFDEARTAGDTTIVEDTTNNKYYVLMFQDRYLSDATTATIRVIMTSTNPGDAIMTEWEENGKTEEAFIALVEKYSEDTYSNTNGGLYEELTTSISSDALSSWIFDEARQTGDATTITEESYTYVLYYVEKGRPEWQAKISSTLLSTIMSEYIESLVEACEVSDPKGHLEYLKPVEVTETTAETTAQ